MDVHGDFFDANLAQLDEYRRAQEKKRRQLTVAQGNRELAVMELNDNIDSKGYDGLILPGMTLCVESYMGSEHGDEGVKLEQQVLITETGIELLSTYPYDDELLNREF